MVLPHYQAVLVELVAVEMEELVVPGELDKASEVGLLTERQEATAVMDMIGQDFISRLGAAHEFGQMALGLGDGNLHGGLQ